MAEKVDKSKQVDKSKKAAENVAAPEAKPSAAATEGRKMMRHGKVGKTPSGQLVLVNEKNEAFTTNPAVVAIWGLCDGRTEKEVGEKIASEANVSAEEIAPAVHEVVAKLLSLGLLK